MNRYDKQAIDFLIATNSTLRIEFIKHDYYFNETDHKRDIYQCILQRGARYYSFNFGQSLANSHEMPRYRKEPSEYDILSCLTKYDVGSFEDFCRDFGYNDLPLSKYDEVKITYDSIVNEYNKLISLYDDEEMEKLAEIN